MPTDKFNRHNIIKLTMSQQHRQFQGAGPKLLQGQLELSDIQSDNLL